MIETKDALRRLIKQTTANISFPKSQRLSEQEVAAYAIATDLMADQTEHPNQPAAPPEEVEAYLTAKYRDKPLPKLSDELRRKLGLGIPKIEP